MNRQLPEDLYSKYEELKTRIKARLNYFSNVQEDLYFYELCFCLCTPQSKAANALIVQNELQRRNFFKHPFDASELLRMPENYIRFHNTKAQRLLDARLTFSDVKNILKSNVSNIQKRNLISETVTGIGMKEASHFMRNIGFRGLAILDRHILKHIVLCGIYDKQPNVSTKNNYLKVEQEFIDFAKEINISVDELDLLFWSYETGEIIK